MPWWLISAALGVLCWPCRNIASAQTEDYDYGEPTTEAPLPFVEGLFVPSCLQPTTCPQLEQFAQVLLDSNAYANVADGYTTYAGLGCEYAFDVIENTHTEPPVITFGTCAAHCNLNSQCRSFTFTPNQIDWQKCQMHVDMCKSVKAASESIEPLYAVKAVPHVSVDNGNYHGFAGSCSRKPLEDSAAVVATIYANRLDTCAMACSVREDCVAFQFNYIDTECALYKYVCTERSLAHSAFLFIKTGETLQPAGNIAHFHSYIGGWQFSDDDLSGDGHIEIPKELEQAPYRACANLCEANENCLGFLWAQRGRDCRLRSRIKMPAAYVRSGLWDGNYITAIKTSLDKRNESGDCSDQPDADNIVREEVTHDERACKMKCNAHPSCAAYMFETSSRACRLRPTACGKKSFKVYNSHYHYGYRDFSTYDQRLHLATIDWSGNLELRDLFRVTFPGSRSHHDEVKKSLPNAKTPVDCLKECKSDCACMSAEFSFLDHSCTNVLTIFSPIMFDRVFPDEFGYPTVFTFLKDPSKLHVNALISGACSRRK